MQDKPQFRVARITCGKRTYDVTPADKLWLLRAVHCEGRVERQVAQALVNLFALTRSKGGKTTLTEIVRAYAQPVNPAWFVGGKQFERWHDINPAQYTEAAARRREYDHCRRNVFHAQVSDAVERALALGPVDVPACATDYAAAWIDASKKYTALTGPERGINRLWTRDETWTGYSVLELIG